MSFHIMTPIEELAARTAINTMLKDAHFSICTIDKVLKLMHIHPDSRSYNILSTLHCINYKDMPQELREQIPALIRVCLSLVPTYQFEELKKETITISQNPFMRLIRGTYE